MSEITVVVPCYNHSKYVERTLRSISAQTLHPKKLFVINDGSTDNSAEIIERVLDDCPFPNELISQENRKIPATLNRGLDLCDTEYFAYLGSDDIWFPNFLEERQKMLDKRQSAVLGYGNAYIIDEDDYIYDRTDNWLEFPDGDAREMLLQSYMCINPSVLYRTKFLKKFRWNEDSILEDYEMYLKLSTEGDFAFDKRMLSGYRLHDTNVSSNYPRQFLEIVKALERCGELLGLSDDELEKVIKRVKFNSVDHFIRMNYRREAVAYLWNNMDVAESNRRIASLIFRLLIPKPIFQWNRKRKKENAIEEYGKLKY